MKINVCIKQVPDTETKIKISSDGNQIDTSGIKWVMNPYDEYAVEEALKLREANPGAQVFIYTVGPKARAAEVLRTALAMGADEGVLIDAPDALDSLTTARALSAAIKKQGAFDYVFGGKLAIDDNLSSVCQQVAELLGVPHVTVVSKATYQSGVVTVEREVEGGSKETIEVKGPAVLATNKGLNNPRYASLPGIMKAKKKTLTEFDLAALGVEAGKSLYSFRKLTLPVEKPAVQMIGGEGPTQAAELVKKLRDEAKVI